VRGAPPGRARTDRRGAAPGKPTADGGGTTEEGGDSRPESRGEGSGGAKVTRGEACGGGEDYRGMVGHVLPVAQDDEAACVAQARVARAVAEEARSAVETAIP